MEKIGLTDHERIWNSYPFELSGGMNQRVGICTAMIMNPGLLLADEPTSALDVTVQKQVAEELLMMRREYHTAVILVTHNIGLVKKMADKILVLKDGQVRDYGGAGEVLEASGDAYTRELMDSVLTLKKNKGGIPGKENKDKGTEYDRNNIKGRASDKDIFNRKGSFPAVRDISFAVKKGEALGIVGESGSGKTTAARLVTGLIRPTEGKIFLMGQEITKAKGRELRKAYRHMQMIFQMPAESLIPDTPLGAESGKV